MASTPLPTTRVHRELGALTTLALPLVAGFVGNQLMGFVDIAMVGRLGKAAIGGVGIGNGIYFTLAILALGCTLGMDPLVAQAVGAREPARARRIYWNGLRVAALVAVPIMVVVLAAMPLLEVFKIDTETAANARSFMKGRVWNVLPLAVFGATRSYLQGVNVTRPIVVSTIVANVINFLADAVLIYGDGALERIGLPGVGLPALGVFGAGLASSLSATASLIVLFVAVDGVEVPPDPDRRRRDPAIMKRILALGLPIGLQMVAEVCAFALSSMLSGRIGRDAAAANQLALSLASMTFMVPLGISSATAVRVGYAVGHGDTPAARLAGLCGLGVSLSFMAVAAVAFVAIPAQLGKILTDDATAIAAAVPLIHIAAMFQLSDGTQVTTAGALRGVGDTRTTLLANLVGHFGVGIPLAVTLAFGAGLGVTGLWWGLSAGLTTVAVVQLTRFLSISSRPIARIEHE